MGLFRVAGKLMEIPVSVAYRFAQEGYEVVEDATSGLTEPVEDFLDDVEEYFEDLFS